MLDWNKAKGYYAKGPYGWIHGALQKAKPEVEALIRKLGIVLTNYDVDRRWLDRDDPRHAEEEKYRSNSFDIWSDAYISSQGMLGMTRVRVHVWVTPDGSWKLGVTPAGESSVIYAATPEGTETDYIIEAITGTFSEQQAARDQKALREYNDRTRQESEKYREEFKKTHQGMYPEQYERYVREMTNRSTAKPPPDIQEADPAWKKTKQLDSLFQNQYGVTWQEALSQLKAAKKQEEEAKELLRQIEEKRTANPDSVPEAAHREAILELEESRARLEALYHAVKKLDPEVSEYYTPSERFTSKDMTGDPAYHPKPHPDTVKYFREKLGLEWQQAVGMDFEQAQEAWKSAMDTLNSAISEKVRYERRVEKYPEDLKQDRIDALSENVRLAELELSHLCELLGLPDNDTSPVAYAEQLSRI